jgi:anhydro-N-acetylmuramic acid kinase
MKKKIYNVLGLMSGTSMDGIDASIIQSNGDTEYNVILDQFFEYDDDVYLELIKIRGKISNLNDLNEFSKEINTLEKKITLFHAEISKKMIEKSNENIDLIGFHGQTIYHNSLESISKQIGDGNLLSQLTKKTVVYNFRENDLKNGGQGAPLTPIFHKLIVKQNKIDLPVCILNIGGISNITAINGYELNDLTSRDIGPGNCLIDEWIRNKSGKKFDENGVISKSGKTNIATLNQALDTFDNQKTKKLLSLDIKDFDLGFVRGLSLEDGASTLIDFSAKIISEELLIFLSKIKDKMWRVLLCGGGRKNTTLIEQIKNQSSRNVNIQNIDDYGVNGDFIESQAFAYIAIRSYLKLPITFPKTTGCKKICTGGKIVKNY